MNTETAPYVDDQTKGSKNGSEESVAFRYARHATVSEVEGVWSIPLHHRDWYRESCPTTLQPTYASTWHCSGQRHACFLLILPRDAVSLEQS